MSGINQKHIKEIAKAVQKEFPNDPALQQVHIARKIIAKEAEIKGLSFIEYIRSLGKEAKASEQGVKSLFLTKIH